MASSAGSTIELFHHVLARNLHLAVELHTGAGWNQPSHDDVLLGYYFVTGAYQGVLGRQPDPYGWIYWVGSNGNLNGLRKLRSLIIS